MLGPLKMSTKDAKKAYLQIWDTKFWSKSQVSERLQILRGALTSLLNSQTENASDSLSTIQMERAENLTPNCKFAVTAMTTANAAQPVVLRAYRSRSSSVQCTLLEALLATLAYQEILPPVPLGEGISELFAATSMEHCNPTAALLEEVPSIFRSKSVSVIVSIGSGNPSPVVLEGQEGLNNTFLNPAKSCRVVSQNIGSQFPQHPGVITRLDVDGFDLSELLQAGKAISYSRAYLLRKETQASMDQLVYSLIKKPKRLEVKHILNLKVETTEKLSNTSDSPSDGRLVGPNLVPQIQSRVREQTVISGEFPFTSNVSETHQTLFPITVKKVLPSHCLHPVKLERLLEGILANWKESNNIDIDITRQKWTVLHAIVCISQPSSAIFVAGLSGVEPQVVTAVVQSLYPVLIIDEVDLRIHICHASFRDFIVAYRNGRFDYRPPLIHLAFAQACVKEMACSLRFNICNLESSFIPDNDLQPSLEERAPKCIGELLAYASRNWWFHMQGCDASGKQAVLTTVEPVFQDQGIFWIEVMSLLGEMESCKEILSRITSSSAVVLMVPLMHLLASEAAQLVSVFEAIPEKTTSHLYLTCLALSEPTPDLDCWRSQFLSFPSVMTKRRDSELGPWKHKGHTDFIWSVVFSPNGKLIASGSEDRTMCIWGVEYNKTIRIWDANSGELLRRLIGHTDYVRSVSFSQDGRYIVSGSEDRTVCIWEAGSGQKLRQLEGHADYVFSVTVSPDGKRIASGSRDRTIRLWDVDSGTELRNLDGHRDYVRSVAFSPDGKRIISGSEDRTVCIWDIDSDVEPKLLHGHTAYVHSVAFSPDGKYIVSGSEDRTLYIWDAETGQKLKCLEGHTDHVFSVAFSPDGKRIVSGSRDKTIRVWDTEVDAEFPPFSGHINSIRSVVFSPQSKRVLPTGYPPAIETSMKTTIVAQNHEVQRETILSVPQSSQRASGRLPIQFEISSESQPPIELPNSPHLPSSIILSTTSSSLHCRDDGWLVTSKEDTGTDRKIIWIPPTLRPFDPQVLLVISREGFNSIDLSGCVFGEGWEQCYAGRT
ncbi:hypothetical protein DL96DRAFT_1825321 [Flagelloscypha sp. PMI_526]|nr:hypothetical protein DL96DRAFT_1825321 [Flagelloscypha sp. PMI_526]